MPALAKGLDDRLKWLAPAPFMLRQLVWTDLYAPADVEMV